jgi:putative two-component system response regulator
MISGSSCLPLARQELVDNHLESVKAIALAVEARDAYTQGHCLRVRFLVRRILERLDVDEAYRRSAETAALLHDVGKIGVPDTLLLESGRLTEEQYSRLMLHVEIGVEILRPLTTLSQTALFVRHHHERYDGTGYPDRLAGAQIPLASRVIAVADAIDAMRSTRPFRKALGVEETIRELRRARGRQLDPEIVDLAIAILDPKGEGQQGTFDAEEPAMIEAGELARA